MSKLVTNFGDSNTIGNTILQQNLTVQGAFSTFSGNILAGSAFSTLGNSTNKFNSVFATTANIPSVNVTGIFGTTGFVGINTTGGGATLNVAGNVWASNALSAPNVFATVSMNALTANTANIFGPLGFVGINTNPGSAGANLQVGGNVWSSNALTAPLVLATVSLNVTGVTNTSAIYGTAGSVGIGGVGTGATLNVAGNVFASNSIVSPNLFALTSMNTPTTNTLSFYGPSGFVGVGTSGSGSTLNVAGNVYSSNALSAPNVFASVSLNVTGVTNTSAIFGTSGSVGIGLNAGTTGGATLNVAGNVWVSNAISTPNIFAALANVTTLNVSTLSGTNGTVGIGTNATGPAFYVAGNLYASNAITAPNAIVATMNISSILNTQSIYSSTGLVGINTSTPGASLHVQGNVFASNALTAPDVFATTSMNTPTLNTTSIYGLASLVGINTTTPGANLHVQGNVYASNALTAPVVFATTSMNTPTLNTTSIFGTSGFVGIGTTSPSASLQVQGNLYATNAFSATNIFATSLNTTVINTASIFGPSGLVGVGGTPLGSTLDVTGNLYASNAVTSPNIVSTTSNITTLNTGAIFGRTGFVGINTTTGGASLTVLGNIYASNALTSPNVVSTTSNITILNTTSIYSTTVGVGINTTATGAAVMIGGNLYASNALTSPNIVSTTSNITTLNTTSIYSTSGGVGINTTATGAALTIGGNLYASNALTGTNLIATGTIYYGEDLMKRSPYLTASAANATTIQTWISATCNAADQPASFWAMSGVPVYGNAASGPTGGSDYGGSVLLPDGRVLFVPANASNVGIYNPATGLFSTIAAAGIPATTGKFRSGVLVPNGNVVFIPWNLSNVGVFNPLSYTYSNIAVGASAAGGTFRFQGGVLGPTGNVIMVPRDSANIGVFNPTTLAMTNVGPIHSGGVSLFGSGVLLPNGNVVMTPTSSAGNIGMYNTYSLTTAGFSNVGPICPAVGSQTWESATLAPNGNVIFAPSTSTNVVVYNPSIVSSPIGAGGFSNVTIFGVAGSNNYFQGSVLLPSGNVVFCPADNSNVGMFDPGTLIYSNCAAVSSSTAKFYGCTLIPSGQVVFTPANAANVGILNTMVPVGPEFCLAPYFNKY